MVPSVVKEGEFPLNNNLKADVLNPIQISSLATKMRELSNRWCDKNGQNWRFPVWVPGPHTPPPYSTPHPYTHPTDTKISSNSFSPLPLNVCVDVATGQFFVCLFVLFCFVLFFCFVFVLFFCFFYLFIYFFAYASTDLTFIQFSIMYVRLLADRNVIG